jgi:hypothetical protein
MGRPSLSVNRTWPKPGQKLTHQFLSRETVVAEVIQVDKKSGQVTVRVGKTAYASLSEAARSITKKPVDGWIFWGLRKARPTNR